MPELPDVETYKRYFDETSLNQTIKDVKVDSPRNILERVSSRKLQRRLKNRKFKSTKRYGKYLLAQLDKDFWLVLHFGMTGFLKYFKEAEKRPPHERLLISFENGYHLAYDSQRKLGMVTLVDGPQDLINKKKLGPDALDPAVDFNDFKEIISVTRSTIKSALMNQKLLAGIGNIYSDEILFQAGIHPETPAARLDGKTLRKLFRVMKRVLKKTIDYRADPNRMPKSYLIPHRGGDDKCPKDGSKLRHIKVSGRTAYFCPKHQNKQ